MTLEEVDFERVLNELPEDAWVRLTEDELYGLWGSEVQGAIVRVYGTYVSTTFAQQVADILVEIKNGSYNKARIWTLHK